MITHNVKHTDPYVCFQNHTNERVVWKIRSYTCAFIRTHGYEPFQTYTSMRTTLNACLVSLLTHTSPLRHAHNRKETFLTGSSCMNAVGAFTVHTQTVIHDVWYTYYCLQNMTCFTITTSGFENLTFGMHHHGISNIKYPLIF